MKYHVSNTALLDEAYAVIAEEFAGLADHSEDLLQGAATLVIEDHRDCRTLAQRNLQRLLAAAFLIQAMADAEDTEPTCP